MCTFLYLLHWLILSVISLPLPVSSRLIHDPFFFLLWSPHPTPTPKARKVDVAEERLTCKVVLQQHVTSEFARCPYNASHEVYSVELRFHMATCEDRQRVQGKIAQGNTVQNTQCSTVGYSTVHYSMIQYSTIQYDTVQNNTVWYSTIQYDTVQNNTVW